MQKQGPHLPLQHLCWQHWLPVVQGTPESKHVVVDVVEDEVLVDVLVELVEVGIVGCTDTPFGGVQGCP